MKVWDLHCDTLYQLRKAENAGTPKSFANNDLMLDLARMRQGDYLLQCLACYIDLAEESDPLQAVQEEIDLFYRILDTNPGALRQIKTPDDIRALPGDGRIGVMLTVEEGGVCRDNLAVLRNLYRLGVRMMTLTWNYKNGLAEPNNVPGSDAPQGAVSIANPDGGLSARGYAFVQQMEEMRMILDVSHLSDGGFWDVVRCTKRPFAASHSNARVLCPHVRNLTDEMIAAMGERGCLVGLNYCGAFLAGGVGRELPSRVVDMARHAKHLIKVGGEDLLALGSDFDGIGGDLEIAGAQDMPKLADALAREGLSERQIEKIFYKNAARFFTENL